MSRTNCKDHFCIIESKLNLTNKVDLPYELEVNDGLDDVHHYQ